MKKNNFGLQWLCQKKPRTCPVLSQDNTVRFLPDRDMRRCLTTSWEIRQWTAVYTHVQNLWASVQLSAGPFQHPETQELLQRRANRQLTGNPCWKFIVATLCMARELVTECTNMIINRHLVPRAPLPLSASYKNHLQTVPSPESDTSQKCKVTASTWNALQSLPLRQTNPSVSGWNLCQLPRTRLR